jgi:hypothetical protein
MFGITMNQAVRIEDAVGTDQPLHALVPCAIRVIIGIVPRPAKVC